MFALDEIQHYPVNWKDGMRVSAKDFMTTDKAWGDALRDVRTTLFQGVQYGLLPPLRDSSDTSAYPKFDFDTAKKLLTLKECRAITAGGYRIEITEALHRQLQVPLAYPTVTIQEQDDFSVYITVDMFSPQGAGKMSADAPPRYQSVSPFYELSVIYESDGIGLSGFNHLKIAAYKYANGRFKRNEQFIPPCMTINAEAKLLDRFKKAGANLSNIHDNGIGLSKIYRIDGNPEVRDTAVWIEKVTLYIAQSIWTYNDYLVQQSPIKTITFFKNLAQFILSTMDIHSGNPYLKEGIQSQKKYFKDLTDSNFSGEDLNTAFYRIDSALSSLHLWFKALRESLRQRREVRVEDMGRKA